MPKRKNKESDDYITRKIRKLEKKLRKRSRKMSSSSSSDNSDIALSLQEGMCEFVYFIISLNIKE